jgi:hypothetical protein
VPDPTVLGGILQEVHRDRIVLAAGTSVLIPPSVSTQDVPVGSTVWVVVTRSERREWVAKEIEYEPRRNGRGK